MSLSIAAASSVQEMKSFSLSSPAGRFAKSRTVDAASGRAAAAGIMELVAK